MHGLSEKKVLGSNGYFSGWGYIILPFLESIKEVVDVANMVSGGQVNLGKFSRIRVEFEDIKINTDYQLVEGMVVTSYDPNRSGIVDVDQAIADIGRLLEELFSRKEELLNQLSSADGFEEQQNIISQINDLEVTIGEQIDQIPNKENLPQELQDELESLKQEGDIVSNTELTSQEITEISTADAARRDRIKEIAAIAEDLESNDENSEEIAFGENEGHPLNKESNTESIVYVSPAGVPVLLPANALPKFYTVTDNSITAYGSLIGFTIEDGPNAGIYNGYRRGNEFTGYKTSKDDEPYVFGELPNTSNIQVRTIGGSDCIFLLFGGQYQADNINPFGTENLSKDWDKGIQWEVLFIGEQNYTTCLPPLDYDGFTEYFIGIYNPFGHGGFLRKVIATDGSVIHVYSITHLERGWVVHFQYNRGNGQWEPIEVPDYNVDTAAALDYLFGQVFSSAAGHLVLDMAGMVPAAGEFFDFANGVWYTIEGDGTSAAISFASTIPLVYATTVKNVGKIVKLANGTTVLVKFSKEATERLVDVLKRLDLDAAQLKKLSDDLVDKEFAEGIAENPELVDAWRLLDEAGVSNTLRKNVDNLDALDAFKKANPNVSDEAIKNALTSLKSSRRQTYLNGLKNVADNNVLSLTNKRLANPDEVKDALNSLRDFRKNNPSVSSSTNVGALDGTINGTPASQLSSNPKWVSGANDTPLTEAPVWSAQNATGSSGASWLRDIDSEYKMLNDMARKLEPNAKVGDVFSSHAGEMKIISEIPYCTSCSGIIQNFNEMFPNIKVVLIDGIK